MLVVIFPFLVQHLMSVSMLVVHLQRGKVVAVWPWVEQLCAVDCIVQSADGLSLIFSHPPR